MASIIASSAPQFNAPMRTAKKDMQTSQPGDNGRATPLPHYEKTQSVPFTLTLQEEKDNPGQFQLVVNIDQKHQQQTGSHLRPPASKKLIANLKAVPSLGYDVSPLYQTLKSSPPSSPQDEKQGWSDLDAIPPEFLNKVVPDWKVTFSRSDSTASSQSRKLADIKARIKKSGKGFVVRLLKGSTTDPDGSDVAEVHLGSQTNTAEHDGKAFTTQELPADTPAVELDASHPLDSHFEPPTGVFEIGSSNEPGIPCSTQTVAAASLPSVNQWLHQVREPSIRASVLEEGLSDAETLLPDFRSITDRLEDTDIEPFSSNSSVMLGRSGSTSSIVKTPTRGLSVVGPVKRVQKATRAKGKGKGVRTNLERSGAQKSFRRSLPRNQAAFAGEGTDLPGRVAQESIDHDMVVSQNRSTDSSSGPDIPQQSSFFTLSSATEPLLRHRYSDERSDEAGASRTRLELQTNLPRAVSANNSPVTKRKRKSRTKKSVSISSSMEIQGRDSQQQSKETYPVWSEVDPSEELKLWAALDKAFGNVADDALPDPTENVSMSDIEKPLGEDAGSILPADIGTRLPPPRVKNPTATFLHLAFTALLDLAFEGLTNLRNTYADEPPVPPKHVRVRWTCSCGDSLYDDFIENKPGAARDLEWYLNRPRSHSPSDPPSKSSTFTSMSSVFDANSRASTLTTPASTYAGNENLWGKQSDTSRYTPTRLRSNNPFSVHIGTSVPESWLLTCANEGRFTPKVVHVDVNSQKIKDDRALALALRDHYDRVNKSWFKWARLRGLSRIEFAQFEVHRNRFADIRAAPSMPPVSSLSNEKSPSQHPYTFEPHDLMPPVGSAYLMHLFKHPEDYEGETLTYHRAPKRRERLQSGMGWGINLVEGFQAQKVWAIMMFGFGIGSMVFAVLWSSKKGDVQGAFGVASWIVTLAGLGVAGLQAWLD